MILSIIYLHMEIVMYNIYAIGFDETHIHPSYTALLQRALTADN
jgi:hypothetical protein